MGGAQPPPMCFNQCRARRKAAEESVKANVEEYSRGGLIEAGQEPQRRNPPSGQAAKPDRPDLPIDPKRYAAGNAPLDCFAR